jgi:hypothetical protein
MRAISWVLHAVGWLLHRTLATVWHLLAWPMNQMLRLLGALGRRVNRWQLGPQAEQLVAPVLQRKGMPQLVLALGAPSSCWSSPPP